MRRTNANSTYGYGLPFPMAERIPNPEDLPGAELPVPRERFRELPELTKYPRWENFRRVLLKEGCYRITYTPNSGWFHYDGTLRCMSSSTMGQTPQKLIDTLP